MKRYFTIIVLFFCAALSLAPAAAAVQSAVVPELITAIEVRGEKTVPEKEITDVIFTRVGEGLAEEKIKGDLKAIYALGDFADVSASFESHAGGTKVVFNVVENPKIENIVIEGNTVYSTAEILGMLGTRKGEALNFKKCRAISKKSTPSTRKTVLCWPG